MSKDGVDEELYLGYLQEKARFRLRLSLYVVNSYCVRKSQWLRIIDLNILFTLMIIPLYIGGDSIQKVA